MRLLHLATLGLVALLGCSRCDEPPAGTLEAVTPLVQLSRGQGEPVAAGNGQALQLGDTVSSDENGGAVLRFANGSSVKLGPSSSLVIEAGSQGLVARQVRLLFGSIEATGNREGLVVMTRLGRIEFGAEDSSVEVSASDSGLNVRTLIGEVTLGENTITAGVAVRLDADGIVFDKPLDAGVADAGGPSLGEIAPIVIVLKGGRGVYRQAGGEGRFAPLKVGEELVTGDVVEARKGSATLGLGEAGEAELAQRSRLQIGSGDTAFRVQSGRSQLRLTAGQRRLVQLGAATAAVVASARGADVEFEQDKRGGRVRVYEGSATVTDGSGKSLQVQANQQVVVDRQGAATVSEVGGSELVINRGVRRVLVAGSLPPVTFSWTDLGGQGPTTFELARDEAFTDRLVVTQVAGRQYTTDRLGLSGYFWRVRQGGETSPVARVRFGRDSGAASDDARKNVVHASGERTVILYQQWQPPQLTFKWPAREGAAQYRLSVYLDGSFDSAVVEELTAEPKLKLTSGTLKDGNYVWAFSALDGDGKVLSTSDMYDLEVKFDSNEMLLRILAPAPGARATGRSIETRGLIAQGASLSVNGADIEVDKAGRFKQNVPLVGQPPMLIFKVGSNLFVRALRR